MKVTLSVCLISALLICSVFSQILTVNQQNDNLLRVTVPKDATVVVDSSFLPTYGYALLGSQSSDNNTNNGSSSDNNDQVGSNSVADLTLARNKRQFNNNNGHTGPLTNQMFVFQLQHVYQLQSNGIQWEQLVVGNESALNSVINQFSLRVSNGSDVVNPSIVAFNLTSPNNELSNVGVIRRQDLINLSNFSSGNVANTQASTTTPTNSGQGNNSVANVADARTVRQINIGSDNNDNIKTFRVLSLTTAMKNAFLGDINPKTRYFAHCYRVSILNLISGVEQDANILTGASLRRSNSGSDNSNIGLSIGTGGVSAGASVGGVGVGGSVGTSGVSGNAGETSSISSLSSISNLIALVGMKDNANNINDGQVELAYMRLVPPNINFTNNPLAGSSFALRRGNFDPSQICVVMPRSNAEETIYNLEFGYMSGDAESALQSLIPNSAAPSSNSPFAVLVAAVVAILFALFI